MESDRPELPLGLASAEGRIPARTGQPKKDAVPRDYRPRCAVTIVGTMRTRSMRSRRLGIYLRGAVRQGKGIDAG